MNWTYDEANRYIADVPKFTKKNKTGHTQEFLRRLGDPQEKMKIIHVAGTNGKGSVCAFMASVLREAGYRTGLFTSPHLVKINERFQVNGEMITDEEFLDAFVYVMKTIDQMVEDGLYHPTYFELLFGLGMVVLANKGCEYLVMETGLGGRLDATNAVAHPTACVITSISLDHTEYLGDTVEAIAGEKAGIIKEGVPVIFDGRIPGVEQVMKAQAEKMHAPFWSFHDSCAEIVGREDTSLTYVLNNELFDDLKVTVPYPADYQVSNSALALTALRVLDPEKKITDEALVKGIADTTWGGRMEAVLPGVILDGAHNADGIEQFLKTVRQMSEKHPTALLFAAVVEKDYEEMIREIAEEADFKWIIVTQIEGSRKVDAQVFADVFSKYTDAKVLARHEVKDAFETALKMKEEDQVLFCAGSLYLVGEIKALLQEMKQ